MTLNWFRRLWQKLSVASRPSRKLRPADQRCESDLRRQLRRERERPLFF